MELPFTPDQFSAVPILWSFIGGSAAALLHVHADYALLAAGVLLIAAVVRSGQNGW